MGHASRFVENDKILMAMFSIYFVVAKKKSYIYIYLSPWFLMFFFQVLFHVSGLQEFSEFILMII